MNYFVQKNRNFLPPRETLFAKLPAKVSLLAIGILFFAVLVVFLVGLRDAGFFLTRVLGVVGLGLGIYVLRNAIRVSVSSKPRLAFINLADHVIQKWNIRPVRRVNIAARWPFA